MLNQLITEAADMMGGQSALARGLSDITGKRLSRQQVHQWATGRTRPTIPWAVALSRLTGRPWREYVDHLHIPEAGG